ncbi:MAG: efflux RND transporter periplasmic adaptor subunit [Candidatus Solibacter sp.]
MKRTHLILLVIPTVFLAGCGSEITAPRSTQLQATPVAVTAVAVTAQEMPVTYIATGTVRARTSGTVSAKVMAYVQQVNAQAGDHVRQGQTLISLDPRDLDSNVRRAEAGLVEAQSGMAELENATAAAKANFDLAQSTFKRIEELAGKKSVSNQELDEASARQRAAQANYEMVGARRSQIASRTGVAEQEVRAARIQREYARIDAPFAGVVTARNVEPGNLASPGVPLFTIEQEGSYRLEAAVDESKLSGVRVGQPVEVAFDAPERRVQSRVVEVVPTVDAASRSYVVKLELPATAPLRTGMFARAFFPLGKQTVQTVPAVAVMERGQLQSVFVVEDGTARTRMVTTGARFGDSVEVLSGLHAGERVIAPVPAGLQEGAKLEVRQ